jgi:hypothetical protein
LIAAGAVVFLLVASQVLLPSFGERRIEDRLTDGGGSADVTLGAVPALRLLFSDGERLEISAHDLNLALNRREQVFEKLDGFSVVDVAIANSTAGPFDLDSFELRRDSSGPYELTASGRTSPSELVDYGIGDLEIPGAGLAGMALDLLGIDADLDVPIELDVQLVSNEGRIEVVSGGGSVAGIPTGPLAELITEAIVVQI